MARRFEGDRLVLASHNPGKVSELRELLAPFAITAVSAAELGLEEPEESGGSFAANARIKALAAARAASRAALADDSGLVVAALAGAPGVQSARWAGPGRDFEMAMAKVERALAKADAQAPGERRAAFVAALCLAWEDGHVELFEGRVEGTLVWPFRGTRGFGYDAMFVPDGHDLTFGEMEPTAKHVLSHRARAFEQLVAACLRA
ncbi:MAG: RdgB/HAM1 family non-canonical purine NTP pyrophosphatase [Alphaproteobacteria bacterium]